MTIIKQIWNWVLNNDWIQFLWNESFNTTYDIAKESFWDIYPNDNMWNKYEWPLHLITKNWIDSNEINNFISLLKFWQTHFINIKPNWVENISWEETINEAYKELKNKR